MHGDKSQSGIFGVHCHLCAGRVQITGEHYHFSGAVAQKRQLRNVSIIHQLDGGGRSIGRIRTGYGHNLTSLGRYGRTAEVYRRRGGIFVGTGRCQCRLHHFNLFGDQIIIGIFLLSVECNFVGALGTAVVGRESDNYRHLVRVNGALHPILFGERIAIIGRIGFYSEFLGSPFRRNINRPVGGYGNGIGGCLRTRIRRRWIIMLRFFDDTFAGNGRNGGNYNE